MGGTSYNISNRTARATDKGYNQVNTSNMSSFFNQMKENVIHPSMNPKGIVIREARDSEVHPNSFPVILALDLTGSMGTIPVLLLKDGLPNIIGGLLDEGAKDVALLFLGIGDHEFDNAPLQVGQFESGDEELDLWLTRTYPEGGGGGNGGESYGLAHYFAARHCVTDAWEKRHQKGVLIVIGDEPNLKNYPTTALKEITGNGDIKSFTDKEILEEAQEKWEVHQINPHGSYGESYWKEALKDHYIEIPDYRQVPNVIKNIVLKYYPKDQLQPEEQKTETSKKDKDKPIML